MREKEEKGKRREKREEGKKKKESRIFLLFSLSLLAVLLYEYT